MIEKQPDRLDLREKLAQVYGAKGDEEKVVQTLQEIVEIDPQNADVHKQIAGIFLRAERFKEAIPHLQTALSITKGSATEYGALGRMMIESEENEVAVKFLIDAAYLFPDSADFPSSSPSPSRGSNAGTRPSSSLKRPSNSPATSSPSC